MRKAITRCHAWFSKAWNTSKGKTNKKLCCHTTVARLNIFLTVMAFFKQKYNINVRKVKTYNNPEETYEFKHLSPFIIFVSPVTFFQSGKICYDIQFLLSLCILLLSWSAIWMGWKVCLRLGNVGCHGLKYEWAEKSVFG